MTLHRSASEKALALIKKHETLRLAAYDDATGKVAVKGMPVNGKLTNGYGHTGLDVWIGQVIEEAQAEEWLKTDVKVAEDAINKWVNAELNQDQFDALVSLVFNIGIGNFYHSTLLQKLNIFNYSAASEQFLVWKYTKGKISTELMKRRNEEQALFLGVSA